MIRLDHVVYATGDLEAAAAQLGLTSVPGGRHPGWGTENRIVALGEEYFELVAVADPAVAASTDFGRAVASGAGLIGWAVATDDLDAVAARLGLEVMGGSRTRPDGTKLRWRLAGVAQAMETGALPFFIQWDGPADLHPGRATPRHPGGIEWLEIAADAGDLHAWLGEHELPLRFVGGPPGLRAVGIGASRVPP